MRVRAIQTGYYGCLRDPDGKHAVFDLKDEKHFSERWMEKVEESQPEEQPEDMGKRPVAELREMAEARGIDHEGVSKKELAAAIEAHDNPGEIQ